MGEESLGHGQFFKKFQQQQGACTIRDNETEQIQLSQSRRNLQKAQGRR